MVFVSDSSGRFGTSYASSCTINNDIKKSAGIKDDYIYRLYLQRNAKEVMENERKKFTSNALKCNCIKCGKK